MNSTRLAAFLILVLNASPMFLRADDSSKKLDQLENSADLIADVANEFSAEEADVLLDDIIDKRVKRKIYGCKDFSTETECEVCLDGFYLSDPTEKIVNGVIIKERKCKECDLDNCKDCKKSAVSNDEVCTKCKVGYIEKFEIVNNRPQTSCVPDPKYRPEKLVGEKNFFIKSRSRYASDVVHKVALQAVRVIRMRYQPHVNHVLANA